MVALQRARGRPKNFADDSAQNIIQSLDRGIDVLKTLALGGAMTLTQIAKSMDASPATIYRILTTCQGRAMVEVDPASQAWSIGSEAFRIGASFLRRSNVATQALPAMRHLVETTGETSNLGIERLDLVIFVSQVETHESIRAFFPPGTQAPMHASGIGKALLSTHSDARLQRLLATAPLERFTPQTIVSADRLYEELRRIRATGFAFDNEEKAIGMRCIAAPIVNFNGETVAGISISGPSNRVTPDKVDYFGNLVKASASQISRSLGADIG